MTDDTPPSSTLVLTLEDPTALIEAVPHLIGFVPHDSLVAVLFRARPGTTRLRSVGTVRVDLPAADRAAEVVHEFLTSVQAARSVAAAVLMAWTDADLRGDLRAPFRRAVVAQQPVLAAASEAVADLGIALRDALVVAGDRFASILCDDPCCCPPDGRPWAAPESSVVSTQVVAGGRRMPVPSRDALGERVAADDALVADALGRPLPVPNVEALERALVTFATQRFLTLDDRVEVLASLALGRVRDAAVAALLEAADEQALEGMAAGERALESQQAFWELLCRTAPPSMAPAAAAFAALSAGLLGDGAMVNLALDRAHEALNAEVAESATGGRNDLEDLQAGNDAEASGMAPTTEPSRFRPGLLIARHHPHAMLVENLTLVLEAGLPPEGVAALLTHVYLGADEVRRDAAG